MVHLKMEGPLEKEIPIGFNHHFQVNPPFVLGGVNMIQLNLPARSS